MVFILVLVFVLMFVLVIVVCLVVFVFVFVDIMMIFLVVLVCFVLFVFCEFGIVECVFGVVCDWLFGGNMVVCVGIIVLFFGVVFLLKYVVDNDMLLIEFCFVGMVFVVVVLFVIGWCVWVCCVVYGFVL